MTGIKIIVADEHSLFLEGICSLLNTETGLEVKGVNNIKDAIRTIREFNPDLILMEWNFIDYYGFDQLKHQSKAKPKILIISGDSYDRQIVDALKAGANGFVLKNISKDDLINAIKAVAKGDYYICKEAAAIIIDNLNRTNLLEPTVEINSILSKREKDILRFISYGFTNAEIAEKLFISSHTVATHRRNLLQKIKAKNTAGLVLYASRLGLLSENQSAS